MALQMSISGSNVGVPFSSAYIRIYQVHGNKEKLNVICWVNASVAARQSEAAPVAQYDYEIPLSALQGDLFPAIYNWLKLQPEFANAIDC